MHESCKINNQGQANQSSKYIKDQRITQATVSRNCKAVQQQCSACLEPCARIWPGYRDITSHKPPAHAANTHTDLPYSAQQSNTASYEQLVRISSRQNHSVLLLNHSRHRIKKNIQPLPLSWRVEQRISCTERVDMDNLHRIAVDTCPEYL
jgi:hypothetical protein